MVFPNLYRKTLKNRKDKYFERKYKNMQERLELTKKIKIILNREMDKKKTGLGPYCYSYVRIKTNGRGIKLTARYAPPLIVGNTGEYELRYPTAEALIKLFITIQNKNELKNVFLNEITNFLIEHKSFEADSSGRNLSRYWVDISSLPLAVLMKLGFKEMAVDGLLKRSRKKRDLYYCLKFLNDYLRYEYTSFTDDQLGKFLDFVKKLSVPAGDPHMIKEEITRQITKIRYDNILKGLEGINFQTNQDKKKIIEKVRYFQFDENLITGMNKIDEHFWNPTTDEFDSSAVIGNMREVFTKYIEKICERIKMKTKEEIPTDERTRLGNLKKYIKEHLKLNRSIITIMNGLIRTLNEEGSHDHITKKEYFRLTRGIMIEIILLLLTKLENFENNQ